MWVRGDRAIAPEPAHHLRHDGAAELLAVAIDAPRVVHVISLPCERLHQPDVLVEPVHLLVVAPSADAAVVVPAVAEEDADRLLPAREHALGVDIAAAEVDEAAHVAQDLAEG